MINTIIKVSITLGLFGIFILLVIFITLKYVDWSTGIEVENGHVTKDYYGTFVINTKDPTKDTITVELDKTVGEMVKEREIVFRVRVE